MLVLTKRNTTSQNTNLPLSTPLYSRTSSVDFMTRLARIMARRSDKPVYVGGELRFWEAEEEAAALKGVVDVVGKLLNGEASVNGQ